MADAESLCPLGVVVQRVLNDEAGEAPENRATALDWFRRAAERGHPYAQLMLGRYLAHGLAGTTDFVEARQWLEAARAAGVTAAELELVRLPAHETMPSLSARAA